MSHNTKIYLGIVAFFIVFAVIIFFIFGYKSMKKDKDETTILIGNDTVWIYQKQNWEYVTDYRLKNYVDELFHVYTDEEKFKDYYFTYNNGWNAYNQNKKEVKLGDSFFAYNTNLEINVDVVKMNKIDNMKYVYRVLEENNLSRKSKFTSLNMFSYDIDNDGNLEDFYAVTNAFPIGFKVDKIFSFAFIVKHDRIYYIYKDVLDYHGYNGCKPYYSFIMDADGDSLKEFVFNCGLYSVSKPIRRLYQFNDNELKLLVSNEI